MESLPNWYFSRGGCPAVVACGYSLSEPHVGRLFKRTDQPPPEYWKQRLQEETAWAGIAHSRNLRLQDWDDGSTAAWLQAHSHSSSDLFKVTAHPPMLHSSSDIYILIAIAPISSLSPPPTLYRRSHTCACWNSTNKKQLKVAAPPAQTDPHLYLFVAGTLQTCTPRSLPSFSTVTDTLLSL